MAQDQSRGIFAYGAEALSRFKKQKILIIGMRGAGAEVAKNLVLTSPQSISIYDPTLVKIEDLAANFYLSEKHVGKVSRAEACQGPLGELNPFTKVVALPKDFNIKAEYRQYTSIIITELLLSYEAIVDLNIKCRKSTPAIGFIWNLCLGLYGFTFVDFGPKHTVFDMTGEPSRSCVVIHVSKGNPGIVTVHEDQKHMYNDGDYVLFQEIEGMTELNRKEPFQIKVEGNYAFSIDDTSNFGDYKTGGIVENVNVPVNMAFRSLEESLESPKPSENELLLNADLRFFDRADLLHMGLRGLLQFYQENKRLPKINDEDECKKVVNLAKQINEKMKAEKKFSVEEVDEKVVFNMARFAEAEITSVCTFFGGVAAQEAFKFVGKYNPIIQWFHYDHFESLPTDDKVNRQRLKSRYDDQISIYGQEIQKKLADQQLFMIGAGALGCEYIKCFAMMGICTEKGKLIVTDNDHIELSNLNRQLLFKQKDIGSLKSNVAASVGQANNPKFNIVPMSGLVIPANEHIFTDEMWDSLDLIIGAVDNVKARMYVDGKAVWHKKPYFDCGTLGTKANSQVILPDLTQSYTDSVDPPETGYAMCTIRNFPTIIEHTIEWGRNQFEGIFTELPANTKDFIKNPDAFMNQIKSGSSITYVLEVLTNMKQLILIKKENKLEGCVKYARNLFEEHFTNQIKKLLFNFPLDAKDSKGLPFWGGPKRPPQIIDFDPKDPMHLLHIKSLANVIAFVSKIKQERNDDIIRKIASSIQVPKFVPKKEAIQVDDNQQVEQTLSGSEEEEVAKLTVELKGLVKGMKPEDFEVVDFEKDDDTNFHVDYVHATANLRARNYKIKECDRLKTRGIAGRIIPAIATSTASITGMMINEIYKLVDKKDKIEAYKNGFFNLGIPIFVMTEPVEATKIKSKEFDMMMGGPITAIPEGHTKWEKVEISGPLTIKELMDMVEKKHEGVSISSVSVGELPLYMLGMTPKERLGRKIEDAIEEITKTKLGPHVGSLRLDVLGDKNNISVVMPPFKYHLKGFPKK